MKSRTAQRGTRNVTQALWNMSHLTLLGFLLLYAATGWHEFPGDSWATFLTMLGLPIAAYQLCYSLWRCGLTDFRTWFVGLSWGFMFGHVWLIGLGRTDLLFWNLIERYDSELLWRTGLYVLCYMQAIFTGLNLCHANSSFRLERDGLVGVPDVGHRTLLAVGWTLVVFALPFRLYADATNVIAAQQSRTFLAVTNAHGPADDFANLIVPGLVALMAGWRANPRRALCLLLVATAYYLGVLTLTGDRRYNVTAILALVLSYVYLRSIRIGLVRGILLISGGAVVLNLLAYVRTIRQGQLIGLGDLSRNFGELVSRNPLIESMAEFGVSFLSVALAVQLVPLEVPFQFGFSFVGAGITLLPAGWMFGDMLSLVSVVGVLIDIDGHPVGSSLPAELYANFGWFGILGALIAGRVLFAIFYSFSRHHRPSHVVIYYSLFYILINLPRSSFVEVFRASLLVWLVPLALMLLYSHMWRNSRKTTNDSGAPRTDVESSLSGVGPQRGRTGRNV